MRSFAFFLSLLGFSSAISCPPGYSDNGSGNCYKSPSSYTRYHFDAYDMCAQSGGYMYDIPNAFVNNEIQEIAENKENIWLGLTCLSNSTTSCVWDDGRAIKAGDFTNFYGRVPNADIGACVVMLVKTGLWYSVDCGYQVQAFAGCQYTPGKQVSKCTQGWKYFRGQCYNGFASLDRYGVQSTCWSECGYLASIHSSGENSFVRDVAIGSYRYYDYSITGLTPSGNSYYWSDGTPYDYSNFGYQNKNLGDCVSMSLTDDVVNTGKWINSQCRASSYVSGVCKRNLTTICSQEPTTTLPPTLSPLECSAPLYVTGSGTIYSPGYPRPSEPNKCEYMITEDSGAQASITFNDLYLDGDSFITLYNSIFDKTPFATITNTGYSWQTYFSNGNSLKVVFNTTGASNNYFKAHYGVDSETPTSEGPLTTTSTYCGGSYYNYGTISSPTDSSYNYKHCVFTLDSEYSNRMCIVFNELNLQYSDNLVLYEGWEGFMQIARVNNNDVGRLFCTSTYNVMVVSSDTYYYDTYYRPRYIGQFAVNGEGLGFGFSETPVFTSTEMSTAVTPESACNGGDFYYSGYISTTNYPNDYPPNMDCDYFLYSNLNRVNIVFEDFLTESCCDYVIVYDTNGSQITKLAGEYKNYTLTSSGSWMRVRFHSDYSYQMRGFIANFNSVY